VTISRNRQHQPAPLPRQRQQCDGAVVGKTFEGAIGDFAFARDRADEQALVIIVMLRADAGLRTHQRIAAVGADHQPRFDVVFAIGHGDACTPASIDRRQ